jgi:predicted phage terminase large subunit-like protein
MSVEAAQEDKKVDLTTAELQFLADNVDHLGESELRVWLEKLDTTVEKSDTEDSQKNFMDFVKKVWPSFIEGAHHEEMAAAFERVARGECKRLIINMPPRHTKSEFASYLLPAWFLGKFPEKKVIQTSHTAELAVGFGRKVRNLVDSDIYKGIFPGVGLQADSKAAGRWATNKGGDYFAIGVGGAVTGKGADILIIDDPHSEQEATLAESNPEVYDKVYEWYTSGPRQRLQPGGSIIIVMTRWSKRDLTAQVVKAAEQRSGEKWEVIEFPAILPDGDPLWPGFWSLAELTALKTELPNGKWMAQYMQAPTSDVSAIVKREWWNIWEHETPPFCEFTIQSWDTAFLKTQRSDYCACTTWGVFYQPNVRGIDVPNIILLNAFKQRMEFPELKQKAYEEYKEWEPDSLIVEAKASGAPLVFELRQMGIPVQEYVPSKGSDKIARLNAVADIFASGRVWVPNTSWAEELVEEVASFPSGDHDDLVDSMTQAMLRFRRGGFIPLDSDEEDEPLEFRSKRNKGYYNV